MGASPVRRPAAGRVNVTNARPRTAGTGADWSGDHVETTALRGQDLASHAAAYARAGLAVLPLHTPADGGCSCGAPGCLSVGKHPRTAHGKDDATTDIRKIAAWWTCWPEANVGVRPPEGVVVLDVDLRAGGPTALVALLTQQGRHLPPTLTANTGGGGLHAWYSCAPPYRGQLCAGVDIKSSSGYLVAPPSPHASGRRYMWANELPIAPAPPWLRQLIRRPTTLKQNIRSVPAGGSADDGLIRVVATAAQGGRNRALHWAACRAADRGAPADLIDQLRDAARSVGLADAEIERTIRSALTSGRGAA